MHLLLFLHPDDRFLTVEKIDEIISADFHLYNKTLLVNRNKLLVHLRFMDPVEVPLANLLACNH